jgi:hypothetical protein
MIAVAACSSDDEPPTDTVIRDEPAADEAPPALDGAGLPPIPDQATADAYIAALDAIDPRIDRDDPESAIDRGRNQCSTIRANPDRAAQVDAVNQRFTSLERPTGWGPEVSEQILDIVHTHLCPTF